MNDQSFVTDGGLETDLIFNHGADLPDFAAFPLLDDDGGRALPDRLLRQLRRDRGRRRRVVAAGDADLAGQPDWGTRLGYDAAALDRVNRAAVEHLQELGSRWSGDLAAIRGERPARAAR